MDLTTALVLLFGGLALLVTTVCAFKYGMERYWWEERNKKLFCELFKEVEKVEAKVHETKGFSKDTQRMFEPLYKTVRKVRKTDMP